MAARIQKGKNCYSVCVMAVVLAIKLMAQMGGRPDSPQSDVCTLWFIIALLTYLIHSPWHAGSESTCST
jgi:hypothetical protein